MTHRKDKLYIVDGFVEHTNTVYLFNGDFWHGNPNIYHKNDINRKNNKTYGELYQKTLHYEETLREHGYEVISVWEKVWNDSKPKRKKRKYTKRRR